MRFERRFPGEGRRRIHRDIDDEILGHLELKARDLEREGRSLDEAWKEALLDFGDRADVGSTCKAIQMKLERNRRRRMKFEDLKGDVMWGARSLRRAPGFTLFATLTLAFGIAANTAIFSVVNGLFFRDVPGVAEPETLVEISRGPGFVSVSHPMFEHFRDNASSLEGLAAFDLLGLAVGREDGPEVVMGLQVSGDYFSVLGTRPASGRFFSPEEGRLPPSETVAVISHSFWTRNLNANPDAVGSTVWLNGKPATIIGIAEEGFAGHAAALDTSIFVPLGSDIPGVHGAQLRDIWSGGLELVGRVTPHTSLDLLGEQLSQLADARIAVENNPDAGAYVARAQPYSPMPGSMRGPAGLFFVILSVLVGLLLLISCVNVANLLLSRSATRRQEIAIRMSLGAGRGRLIRQLLTESVLLALLAGGIGVLLAYWGTSILSSFQLPVAPIPGLRLNLHLTPDGPVLLFSILLATLTGIVFGLMPAIRATRADLVTDLKDGRGGGRERTRQLQNALVGGQVAATIVLLASAGLFLRAAMAAQTLDPGFDVEDVHVANFDLELAGRTNGDSWQFYRQLLEQTSVLPGVEVAAVAGKLPLAGLSQMGPVTFEGVAPPEGLNGFSLANQSVGPAYFEALGLSVLEGRGLGPQDRSDAPAVVVVNQRLANRYWPNESAVGKHIEMPSSNGFTRVWEVVGVVETAKYRRLNEDPRPFAYFPASQRPKTSMFLHVKMAPGMAPPIHEIRMAATRLEPAAAMLSSGTLDSAIGIFLLPQRIGAWVGGIVGALGLLLGGIGVYGITAYWVATRAREVGIRKALGADTGAIVRDVLKAGMRAPLIGAVSGLAIALVASRFLESFLFGVSPLDPATFGGVLAVLGGIALLANLIPALRAAGVEPAEVLRVD